MKRQLVRLLQIAGFHKSVLRLQHTPDLGLLPYLVPRDRLAVDIGAAEGLYLLHLLRLAPCVAIEPNPQSFSRLKRMFPQIDIRNFAASSKHGTAELRIPQVNGVSYNGYGTIDPNNSMNELPADHKLQCFSVRTAPVDSLGLQNVGFIKIDVEGHEADVIDGARNLLTRDHPICLMEIGTLARGCDPFRVFKAMTDLGYETLWLDEQQQLRPLKNPQDGCATAVFL